MGKDGWKEAPEDKVRTVAVELADATHGQQGLARVLLIRAELSL